MKRPIAVIILLFCTAAVFAADFGVVLGTEGGYAGALSPEGFSVSAYASPWVSVLWNEKISLHASGKAAYTYEETPEPPGAFFFEAERTELYWRPAPAVSVTLGRQQFRDALGLAVSGLFDGVGGGIDLGIGRLSLGAFYTGLLYKETAKIIMTSRDLQKYQEAFDAEHLTGYFASRRVLVALTGEFPGLTPRTALTVQGLAQFDVNGTADTLHTQYLEIRFTAEPLEPLHLEAGVLGELLQGGDGIRGSAAASAGMDWEVPGAAPDLLSAKFLWTSGRTGEKVSAYIPVGGVGSGRVFDPGLGALMSGGLSYQVRPLAVLSAEAGMAYFIRTDLETLGDADLEGTSDSRLLGGEVYGSLVCAPDPALRFSLGGGVFFPQWGAVFRAGAPVRGKLSLGLIVSL